ncbi:MAG: hypothetical protein IJ575_09700 [Selenomonadaceae bacterium]|nr:hypothetical protein [Selenomonadaceae bacterium]
MAIVRVRLKDLPPLTDEDIKRLEDAAKRPPVYDPENLPITDEEFDRNGISHEKVQNSPTHERNVHR